MSKRTLGDVAIQEIRDAMVGLSGAAAQRQITVMAQRYGVSRGYLYLRTKDLRPRRKPRAGKGLRREKLKEDPAFKLAMGLVHTGNLKPEFAVLVAEKQGMQFPVSLGHFQRTLRQFGIHRAAQRRNVAPYRSWEAKAPGDLFQIDFSGLKERWLDLTTRRILHVSPLEVSRNHPNTNPGRVPVWGAVLKDDHSRRRYVRFIAAEKLNSMDVIDYLLEAFRELGIPLVLYSDRDAIIRSRRMFRAETILDNAFKESGGFRMVQHQAGNSKATGKVENAHQVVSEYSKLIGVSTQERTLDELNQFAREIDEHYNWRIHRTTGERPIERWQAGTMALRIPPPKLLDSAFKSDEFECRIGARVTIEFQGAMYQLPRERPYTDWIEQKVTVLWPPDEEYFWLLGLDGETYQVDRVLARTDAAGEFKRTEESSRQILSKQLKAEDKERRKLAKKTGEDLLVPGFEVPLNDAKPALMPKKKIPTNPALLPPTFAGHPLDIFAATRLLIAEGLFATPIAVEEKQWLAEAFAGRESMLDTELRAALALRNVRTASGSDRVVLRSA